MELVCYRCYAVIPCDLVYLECPYVVRYGLSVKDSDSASRYADLDLAQQHDLLRIIRLGKNRHHRGLSGLIQPVDELWFVALGNPTGSSCIGRNANRLAAVRCHNNTVRYINCTNN